ncbi:MAG: sigma-70 family RNA polymerase sigma factor [Bacteroidales bacterium]|nr:sigma-70 family RNA polymerase sigma factor [Bacteroidales bacterium]
MGKRRLNVNERSDRELIAGGLEGKLNFREVLYKRYFSYAMSIAVRYTGNRNEAIEVVNDSFMKVLDKLEDYNVDKPFKPWYGRIVVNTAIDGFRKKKKDDILMSSDNTVYEDIKDPEIEMTLTVNDILALFSRLPEIYS